MLLLEIPVHSISSIRNSRSFNQVK